MGGKKEFEFWKTNSILSTGIDRYNTEAMKELDSERDDLLRQLGIESSLESTVSQLINPLEQMFSFLPEKKQVAVMKAIGSEGWKTFTGRKTLKTPRMRWKFQSHNTV